MYINVLCTYTPFNNNGVYFKSKKHSLYNFQESTKKHHDEKIFNLSCRCSECSKHRETVIQLYLEDYEYNQLWERLQKHLLTFYDIIPQYVKVLLYVNFKN